MEKVIELIFQEEKFLIKEGILKEVKKMRIEDYPFTILLSIVGLIIGLVLPSGLNYLVNMEWFNSSDPTATITGAVIGVPIVILLEVVSGLVGALIFCIIGLVIDSIKNSNYTKILKLKCQPRL